MYNFKLQAIYPWLFLLIIPAVIFTLIPYFRLNKRYRRTRNRITSIVLHLAIMLMAITLLAGFTVAYQVPNETNEIILLVDKSNTEEQSQVMRDQLVADLIEESRFDNFNVGVVTFGYDQKYAVPFTQDVDTVYNAYMSADNPDISATNVADALLYAKTLFTYPETGKIILITDGKETDLNASQVIRSVSAQGITVDVAYVPSSYTGVDAQIVGVEMPDYHVGVGVQCEIGVTVESHTEQTIALELLDNGELDAEKGRQIVSTSNVAKTFLFKHTFMTDGMHEIRFKLTNPEDTLEENNEYCTYYYLEVFDDILIVERANGESQALINMMETADSDTEYNFKVVNASSEDMPTTVNALRHYDQVILNNIANADLPEGFADMLAEYVEQYGGGLFTVGGDDENGDANSYKRDDMYGTTYQKLLPVQAINYTPPVGVMVIIDRSGSMSMPDDKGKPFLEGAKAGAYKCLDALFERDYIGIMTLDEYQSTILELTPRTQTLKIQNAIDSIETANGGTIFSNAIQRAGAALRQLDVVAKRHIIVISDGEVSSQDGKYLDAIADCYASGVTVSVVGVDMSEQAQGWMEEAVKQGGGRLYNARNSGQLATMMAEDLNAPEIKDVNEEEFAPIVYNPTSPLVQGLERSQEQGANKNSLTMKLGGFYGVKIKPNADLVLVGDYEVPIYAQWRYGKGMVGSFMCDLQNSAWSSDFMSDENGVAFISRVIGNLMPVSNIQPSEMSLSLKEDNYTNTLSVITDVGEGESVVGEISKDGVTVSLNQITNRETTGQNSLYVTTPLSAENNYTRCGFVAKESGIYTITLKKIDENGNVLQEEVLYKSFAYSKEYDSIDEQTKEEIGTALASLAEKGNGMLITDFEDLRAVFANFLTDIDKVFDPRILFAILMIVLFLADIAVRKFKFKWPHELIRDYKKKKEMQQKNIK